MHKIYFFWYGLVWLVLAGLSIAAYRTIAAGQCFFQSSNLFCPPQLNISEKIFVFAVFALMTGVFVFFGRYLWKSYIKDEMPPHKIVLLVFSFMLISVLVVPFGSSDSSYYFYAGKAFAEGKNTYVESWMMKKEFVYPVPNEEIFSFSYGPIISTAFKNIYKLTGANLVRFNIVWKFLMFVSLVVLVDLTYQLAKAIAGPVHKRNFFIAFALQPIFLFEWLTNGHFDVLWLITVVGAVLAAHYKKWWIVIPVLAIGVWIKFIPLLISPLFVLWWWQSINKENAKRQILQTLAGMVLAGVVTVASWYPYWRGTEVFRSVVVQSKWAVISLFATLYYALKPIFTLVFDDKAHWFLTRAVQGSLLLVLVVLLWPYLKKMLLIFIKKLSWSTSEYIQAILVCLLAYLLIWQKSFLPWYGAWFLPFAIVLISSVKSQRAYKIAAWMSTAPFAYYVLWLGDWLITRTDAGSELWFYACMVAVVAVYPLYILWQWRKSGFELEKPETTVSSN